MARPGDADVGSTRRRHRKHCMCPCHKKKEKPMAKKGSWIVTLREEVRRQVVCVDCTMEEAEEDPYAYIEHDTQGSVLVFEVEEIEEKK